MGIQFSENPTIFHVPYGPANSDGTPHTSFVDLKRHPERIPLLPSCVGWPETRDLLQTINAPDAPFMSLAAAQGFSNSTQGDGAIALASFVLFCYADTARNRKSEVQALAEWLRTRLAELIQTASNELDRSLFLDIVLELQPTRFHDDTFDGWSLAVLMAGHGSDAGDARTTWRIGVKALETLLSHDPNEV